mmetsp:Transcript_5477/g.7205  ORF Transcript_5477/g.7205 Transcript_5477/m.7205 type:complete len:1072 (-) Transcript_5477:322-3537(-)
MGKEALAPRACETCKKRKTKCDRVIPECGTCVKFHRKCYYDPKTKLRTCIACAKLKARCSRDLPSCKRCISKGIICEYPSATGDYNSPRYEEGNPHISSPRKKLKTETNSVSQQAGQQSAQERKPPPDESVPPNLEHYVELWAKQKGLDMKAVHQLLEKSGTSQQQQPSSSSSGGASARSGQGLGPVAAPLAGFQIPQGPIGVGAAANPELWREALEVAAAGLSTTTGSGGGGGVPAGAGGGQVSSPRMMSLFQDPGGSFMRMLPSEVPPQLLHHQPSDPMGMAALKSVPGFPNPLMINEAMALRTQLASPFSLQHHLGSPLQFAGPASQGFPPSNFMQGASSALIQHLNLQMMTSPTFQQKVEAMGNLSAAGLNQAPQAAPAPSLNGDVPDQKQVLNLMGRTVPNGAGPSVGQKPDQKTPINALMASNAVLFTTAQNTRPPAVALHSPTNLPAPKTEPIKSSRSPEKGGISNLKPDYFSLKSDYETPADKDQGQQSSSRPVDLTMTLVILNVLKRKQRQLEFTNPECVPESPFETVSTPGGNLSTEESHEETPENISRCFLEEALPMGGNDNKDDQKEMEGKMGETLSSVKEKPLCPSNSADRSSKRNKMATLSVVTSHDSYRPGWNNNPGRLLSPAANRLPAENTLVGSKCGLLLSTFVSRFSVCCEFIVSSSSISKAIHRAVMDPRGAVSLLMDKGEMADIEVKERANHASLLAAIGLGSIQEWLIDDALLKQVYGTISRVIEKCSSQSNEEVMFAHGLCALFCLLTNNIESFIKNYQSLNSLVMAFQSDHKLISKILGIQSYLSMWPLMNNEPAQLDKYVWEILQSQVNKFCCLEKDFPQLYEYSQKQAQDGSKLSERQKQIVLSYATIAPFQTVQVLSLPTVRWTRMLLIDDKCSDDLKVKALEEVINFINLCSKYYKCQGPKFPPILKLYLMSTQTFLMFMAGKAYEAKDLLKRQVEMYCNDPLNCIFAMTTNLVHQLHFLSMGLSTVDMASEYHKFQKRINQIAGFLGRPSFPTQPPLSNHGLCDEPECMLVWYRLSLPKIPDFISRIDLSPEFWDVGLEDVVG